MEKIRENFGFFRKNFEKFQKKENTRLQKYQGKASIPSVALRGAVPAPRFTGFNIPSPKTNVSSSLRGRVPDSPNKQNETA